MRRSANRATQKSSALSGTANAVSVTRPVPRRPCGACGQRKNVRIVPGGLRHRGNKGGMWPPERSYQASTDRHDRCQLNNAAPGRLRGESVKLNAAGPLSGGRDLRHNGFDLPRVIADGVIHSQQLV